MAGLVQCPTNVLSITCSTGSYVPNASGIITDGTDTDVTTLTESFNQPHVVSFVSQTATTISLPGIITSILVGTATYTPDGTQYNLITGDDANMTTIVEQGFKLVDEIT